MLYQLSYSRDGFRLALGALDGNAIRGALPGLIP